MSGEKCMTWPKGGLAVPNHRYVHCFFALMSDAGYIPVSM